MLDYRLKNKKVTPHGVAEGENKMEMQIVRKIDKLGRIVIPKDVRTSLGLDKDDDLEIRIENGCIVLRKKKKA